MAAAPRRAPTTFTRADVECSGPSTSRTATSWRGAPSRAATSPRWAGRDVPRRHATGRAEVAAPRCRPGVGRFLDRSAHLCDEQPRRRPAVHRRPRGPGALLRPRRRRQDHRRGDDRRRSPRSRRYEVRGVALGRQRRRAAALHPRTSLLPRRPAWRPPAHDCAGAAPGGVRGRGEEQAGTAHAKARALVRQRPAVGSVALVTPSTGAPLPLAGRRASRRRQRLTGRCSSCSTR